MGSRNEFAKEGAKLDNCAPEDCSTCGEDCGSRIDLNERVEVLSKRSIREKLLSYLNIVSKKKGKKSFYLPLTYTELADYLSIDRSAMMREIKNLKDEGFIYSNGKKLTIKEY